MAIVEKSGFLKYKDSDGNTNLMYPITTKDNVDGMDEVDEHISDQNNPHAVTAEQTGAVSKTGDTMTGALTIDKTDSSGYVKLTEDGEGGTIQLSGKSGTYVYEIDAFNDSTIRVHTDYKHPDDVESHFMSWSGETGTLTVEDMAIGSPLEVKYGGTGATDAAAARTNLGITPANIGAAPDEHEHLFNNGVTTSGDGAAYTVTLDGVTALTAGLSFIMIPHTTSTSTTPTLNVNSLGAKTIKRRISNLTSTTTTGYSASWLYSGKPIRMVYDGTYWIADGYTKPAAVDLYGTLAIDKGGTGATTAANALTNLGAVSKTGGSVSGYLDFASTSTGLKWATANGAEICLRPYSPANMFQVTIQNNTTDPTVSEYGALNISTVDGTITLNKPLGLSSGGTGATTVLDALINLGITDANVKDFVATDAVDWENQVKAYILENVQTRIPFYFSAGWSGKNFGNGVAWNMAGSETFVMIYNGSGTGGVKFWRHLNDTWGDVFANDMVVYSSTEPEYIAGKIWLKPVE